MPIAKKRGKKWRCLAYVGTENGKRKYKSFTARTKREAEALAARYEAVPDVSVIQAVEAYIAMKEAVLSPSTIRAYKAYQKAMESIGKRDLNALTDADVQRWVSEMVKNGKSAKYIRNVYGLLNASVRLMRPHRAISATLPTRTRKLSYTPTNDEIRAILPLYDEEMQRAILLAAYCSLRCGEICALSGADLNGDLLTINKALARNSAGEYVVKSPKTPGSNRTIIVPEFVREKLPNGAFVTRSPLAVSLEFAKVAKANNIPFRFHDLRHFFASELAKTMPLAVVERMGGWAPGSPVLRQIYIGAQEAEMVRNMTAAAAVFQNMQPETQP